MALTQITTNGIKDGTITGTDLATNVDLADNQKLRLGTGNDLSVYHDGSNSFIQDVGTGNLYIQSTSAGVYIQKVGGEDMGKFIADGAVKLFHDNFEAFTTTADGIQAATSSGEGSIYIKGGEGGSSALYLHADQADDNNDQYRLIATDNDAIFLQNYASGGWETNFKAIGNGATELYYDNSKKFETVSDGTQVNGNLTVDNSSGNNLTLVTRVANGNDSHFKFNKSRGNAVVQDNDNLGTINWFGHDGTDHRSAAQIRADVDGTPGTNDMPGRLTFFTTPAGAISPVGRLRIENDGAVRIPNDTGKFTFGAGSDLQIYHDGTDSFIKNTTGNLIIGDTTGNVILQGKFGEDSLICKPDGAVELNFDNTKKFETTSGGVKATGNIELTENVYLFDSKKLLLGNAQDLQIYHDGTDSILYNNTGVLAVRGNDVQLTSKSTEKYFRGVLNGAVELFYDNSKKFETASHGVTFFGTGFHGDNIVSAFGNSSDLQIYHDGNSRIVNTTNYLTIKSDQFALQNQAGDHDYITVPTANQGVRLHYDNVVKFETLTDGVSVTGHVRLGDDSQLSVGASNDCSLSHSSTYNNTLLYNGTGDFYLRTGTQVIFQNTSGNETYATFVENHGVNLYYDNSKKFETISTGARIQHTTNLGSTAGNASDILQLHQSDAANVTTYDFMNYRFANGSTHATSEMRFRRHVDITDQGYWGLRDGACTAGYGNQENFRIDNVGRATAPYQVGFTAYSTSNSFSLAAGGKVPFNAVGTGFGSFTNRTTYGGTNFYSTSNARFTAPVAGLYLFIVCIYFHSTNSSSLCTIVPRKNGNEITNGNNTVFFMSANGHSEGHTPNGSLLLQLDANDYIEVYRRVGQSGTNSCYGSHSHFQGFLVG